MKIRFATKEMAEVAIKTTYHGCTAMFISNHYAEAHGVQTGGWYLYSRNPGVFGGVCISTMR
jgi:hypothetical protein